MLGRISGFYLVSIFCHSHIKQATSSKFSGPVYHPMEQLMYKFYVYISNDIYFISFFVTYAYLLKTRQMCKKCFLTRLASILRNGYGITNNCHRAPIDILFYG